jgi:hypothetical protein
MSFLRQIYQPIREGFLESLQLAIAIIAAILTAISSFIHDHHAPSNHDKKPESANHSSV